MTTTKKISATIMFAVLACSCGANQGILESGKQSPVPANSTQEKSSMDRELEAMRNAGFEWVYLLRRIDGQKMDANDRSFIKDLTADANRRVVTDDEMYIVIGINSELPMDVTDKLLKRFSMGTYPKSRMKKNANTNPDTNSNATSDK